MSKSVINALKNILQNIKYRNESISQPGLISLKSSVIDSKFLGPVIVAKNCNVRKCKIGGYTSIGENVTVSNTIIGRFTSIARGCIINPRSHPLDRMTTSSFPYNKAFGINSVSEVFENESFIGNDVWIGANVIILPGVCIADGAVIGAGSVVTKNVKSHDIVAGNPAKIIGKRTVFMPSSDRDHWYNWEEQDLIKSMDFFLSSDN